MGDNDQAILTAVNSLHGKIDENSKETHKRIDKLVGSVGNIQVSMKGVKVSLDTVKEDVNGHLEDHKQSGRDVFKGILTTVFTVSGLVLAAWVIYEMGLK